MSDGVRDLGVAVQALEYAPCGAVVASTRADGEMLYVNREFTRITGYRLEDLPTVQDWLLNAYPDPEYRAFVLGNWERDVSEPDRDVVYRVRCADGGDKHLLLRAAMLAGDRMVVTMLDFTQQEQMTRALRESEERFRQLADTVPTGLVVHTQGRIVYANRAAARIANAVNPDDLLGGEVFGFVHPDYLEITQSRIAKVYAKASDAEWIESRFQRGDGSPLPVEVASARIDWRGAPAGLVIFNDITDRLLVQEEQRSLERRMLEAQRMESLAVLAGGVAHDFNNLLVGILGNADLAQRELPADSPLRARLKHIELAAQRSAELARQMLAYSGGGDLADETLDLQALLREMKQLLESGLSHSAVISYRGLEDLPRVRGDATQLRQVFMNLITNAADAIEDGGSIGIHATLRQRGAADPPPAWPGPPLSAGLYVAVTVTDDGGGMDEPTLRRIFEPFYSTKENGRGLGLASVLGIVKGHGGAISVFSQPGRGSRFEVLLPALEDGIDERFVESSAPAAEVDEQIRTVLMVDDDETVLFVGSNMLEHGGYEVITAEGGERAVELFRERGAEIDLVLLDLRMPGMDGRRCLELLQELDPGVRVVLSSGYGEHEARKRLAGLVPTAFIQKPYRTAALLEIIRRVLR